MANEIFRIDRRGFLRLAAIGLAGFTIDRGRRINQVKLVGVADEVINVTPVLEDGKGITVYRNPDNTEKTGIILNEETKPYKKFYIVFPEIYEDQQGQNWIKLKGILKSNNRKIDAYIPHQETDHVSLGRQGKLVLVKKIYGEYINPATRTTPLKRMYTIGEIREVLD